MIKIKKWLNLPISGAPERRIAQDYQPSKGAILGADFHGLKPTLQVAEGGMPSLHEPSDHQLIAVRLAFRQEPSAL